MTQDIFTVTSVFSHDILMDQISFQTAITLFLALSVRVSLSLTLLTVIYHLSTYLYIMCGLSHFNEWLITDLILLIYKPVTRTTYLLSEWYLILKVFFFLFALFSFLLLENSRWLL